MNPSDPILDSLLAAVRQTKRHRQARRTVLATAACVLAAAACLAIPRQEASPLAAVAVSSEPSPVLEPIPPTTLAMLVWQDGAPSLEELPAEDLGLVELQFGLEPVIAYPDAFWRDPWN